MSKSNDYLYYVSYARDDRDEDKFNVIRTFCRDLEQEVRMLTGLEDDVGFFDGNDTRPGNIWPDVLSEALCTSRVFVPIFSPTYFNKEYCGREWKIFRDRLEAYKWQYPEARVESLIQPVLFVDPSRLPALPDAVSNIQYLYDRYPMDYATEGLHVLCRVGRYKDSYEMFVIQFARRLVDVAAEYPLPPMVPLPDIEQTMSAFDQTHTQGLVSISGGERHTYPDDRGENRRGEPRRRGGGDPSTASSTQKVMISSSARDLPEHRKQVMDACLRQDMFPIMMEHLPASDEEAVEASLRMVDEADLYIGVFAYRYGYVPKTDNPRQISITEMEYERAVQRDIPRLIFIIDEEHPVKASEVEFGEGATKLDALRKRLLKDQIVAIFTSATDLRAHVIDSLSHYRDIDLTSFPYISEVPEPPRLLRTFLCHSSEDKLAVRELYIWLQNKGVDPWLDEENLVGGEEWEQEIPKAVRDSDVVIVCLSRSSVTEGGYIQKEIQYALNVADEQPKGTIYIIPLRLEECDVPEPLGRWHWLNLFEERGHKRLMLALRKRAKQIGATILERPLISKQPFMDKPLPEYPPGQEPTSKQETNASATAATASNVANREIFISYAWGDESEEIANELDRAFQARGVTIVRDKRDLGFKGRIKAFMERIGRGKCVILIISKRYLESKNCWFELLHVAKNGLFYERVFPIVLADARIYEPVERLRYVRHWEVKTEELDKAMKSVSAAHLQGFREEIDLYAEIRTQLARLTDILQDMNALTPEIHRESDFAELVNAVMAKLSD